MKKEEAAAAAEAIRSLFTPPERIELFSVSVYL
jgi:hypothetical protein